MDGDLPGLSLNSIYGEYEQDDYQDEQADDMPASNTFSYPSHQEQIHISGFLFLFFCPPFSRCFRRLTSLFCFLRGRIDSDPNVAAPGVQCR